MADVKTLAASAVVLPSHGACAGMSVAHAAHCCRAACARPLPVGRTLSPHHFQSSFDALLERSGMMAELSQIFFSLKPPTDLRWFAHQSDTNDTMMGHWA